MLLADIATGNTEAADVMFLIALLVGALGAIVALARPTLVHFAVAAISVAVGLIAFGFLLL